ncbi:MAG: hypothetical protein JRC86_05975 [Deltaproteobacteria bacterium]|nr:hypothetical protein [Deltaproteobacteria bacterium]
MIYEEILVEVAFYEKFALEMPTFTAVTSKPNEDGYDDDVDGQQAYIATRYGLTAEKLMTFNVEQRLLGHSVYYEVELD